MSLTFVPSATLPQPCVLPMIWATGAELPVHTPPQDQLEPQLCFYRPYTEALLRRYVKMSMEAGKVPSLIGQEMFRSKVTNYRVGNFDDVVIFLCDVDQCVERLDPEQQRLVQRIGLQQYTVGETAEILCLAPRTVIRRYAVALDRLSRIFLAAKMLEPLKSCQGGLD